MYLMSTDNRFGRSEGGQVLILSVLFMTAIFMLGVFVVDLGLWVSERRVAQTAADMAAMAGAVSLSQGNTSEAVDKAKEWATKNGYTQGTDNATVIVNYPYNSDNTKIEVEVSKPATLLFGSIFSLAGIDVGARAVSSALTGAHFYAIFSGNSDCNQNGGIQWGANDVTVTGDVHANGQLKIQGGSNAGDSITGHTTYVCSNSSWPGGDSTFNPPPTQRGFLDWPVTYHASQFTCDFPLTGGSLDFTNVQYWKNNDPTTNTLKSGVYCDSGTLNFSGSGSGIKSENCATTPPPCGVTFIGHAGVKLAGSGGDLWPYNGPHAPANANVLALCDPTSQGVAAGGLTGLALLAAKPSKTPTPTPLPTPSPTQSPTPSPTPTPAPSPTPSPTPTPPPAGSCDIKMSGANGTWRGLLIDQYGTVDIQSAGGSGGTLSVVGALVGVTVKLNVQGFVLTGAYLPNTSNVSVALVQ